MIPFQSAGMAFNGKSFLILDQTLLPQQEKWLECNNVQSLVEIIDRLAIRGAPAIGIAAAILLALLAERGCSREDLVLKAATLRASRPTAVNLGHYLDKLTEKIPSDDYPDSVVRVAEEIYQEDIALCNRMAHLGADLIQPGEKLITHCHTGSIATAGVGTAIGVFAEAHRQGKDIFIWVDETRPLLQGGRLTSWECLKLGIPHKIICDSSAAMLMKKGKVDRIFVGADRIAVNGDFANKIGTYSLAVAAHFHNVPFYVVAPQTTVDPLCPDGENIPIEERPAKEIQGVQGSFGSCRWCPELSEVYNPAFDVTPASLVTAWIIDSGVFSQKDLIRQRWWQGK